jgi:hypothetical protein
MNFFSFLISCGISEYFLGFLKKEYSEVSVLEVKEYCLRLEKYKNDIVKKIDEGFKKIINLLKDRKENLSNEIEEKFFEEKEKILFEENRWVDKKDISEKLKELFKENNSIILLINSKYICEGIRTLNEKLEFKEMKVYNDLDENLNMEKEIKNQNVEISLSVDEIIGNFAEYMSAENVNILEYKA